jgi:hypothetical protein
MTGVTAIRSPPIPSPLPKNAKRATPKKVQENARLMAQQRELDPSVLEAWLAEIDWVFSGAQKSSGPAANRQRRFDECLSKKGK